MLTAIDDSCSISSVSTSPLLKLRQKVSFQVAMPVPTVQLATPEAVLDLAFSFRSSQALLTAVKLDVFTRLSEGEEGQNMTSDRIASLLKLNPFAATDFCDALVAMKLLHRHGNGPTAVYTNTYESRTYLSRGRNSYFGDLLLKCEESYRDWVNLPDLLKRGSKKHEGALRIGDVMERDIRSAKERVLTGLSESFCEISESEDEPFTWGLTVEEIFKIAYAFGPSRVVLSFHDMDLFTHLAKNGDQTAAQISKHLGLDEKKLEICLAMLVGYKILTRKVVAKKLVYSNAPAAATYLNKTKDAYIGGVLENGSQYEYEMWLHLLESMSQDGGVRSNGKTYLENHYRTVGTDSYFQSLKEINGKAFQTFADTFDFGMRRTMVDLGAGTGQLSSIVAATNKRIRCLSTDLPSVVEKTAFGHSSTCGRVVSMGLNFFQQELPRADMITLAHVFSECSLAEKQQLINKAYDALPLGGALVVIDHVVDDDRKLAANELLGSLRVLLDRDCADERYGYSHADFSRWIKSAGFQSSQVLDLGRGSHTALVAVK